MTTELDFDYEEWAAILAIREASIGEPEGGFLTIKDIMKMDPHRRGEATIRRLILTQCDSGVMEKRQYKQGSHWTWFYRPMPMTRRKQSEPVPGKDGG